MFDVAGVAGSRSAKKNFNHLPANHDWMSMLAGEFGNHGPNLVVGLEEFIFELLDGLLAGSRTIGQGDDGGIASAIEHLVQTGLQRAELSAFWIGIADQEGRIGIDDGSNAVRILTGYDNHQLS